MASEVIAAVPMPGIVGRNWNTFYRAAGIVRHVCVCGNTVSTGLFVTDYPGGGDAGHPQETPQRRVEFTVRCGDRVTVGPWASRRPSCSWACRTPAYRS